MPPNENWIGSFPVGNMLILRFFGLLFFRVTTSSPPLSSLSSLAFAAAAAVVGCLLVARLLLGFILALGRVSFISLPARPLFVFFFLGCSTTWISSSSSSEVAFLLPFFREAAAAATTRTWSSDSSDSVAFAFPFFVLGSGISSISLSSSGAGVGDFLGGRGALPPVDLRAVLLWGWCEDSTLVNFRGTISMVVWWEDEGLTDLALALRRGGEGDRGASISIGSSSSEAVSSRWGRVETLFFWSIVKVSQERKRKIQEINKPEGVTTDGL